MSIILIYNYDNVLDVFAKGYKGLLVSDRQDSGCLAIETVSCDRTVPPLAVA